MLALMWPLAQETIEYIFLASFLEYFEAIVSSMTVLTSMSHNGMKDAMIRLITVLLKFASMYVVLPAPLLVLYR